jgi:hypothetical protein
MNCLNPVISTQVPLEFIVAVPLESAPRFNRSVHHLHFRLRQELCQKDRYKTQAR